MPDPTQNQLQKALVMLAPLRQADEAFHGGKLHDLLEANRRVGSRPDPSIDRKMFGAISTIENKWSEIHDLLRSLPAE